MHIKSLALQRLGLYEHNLRNATGGMANARTILNLEVIDSSLLQH
jgi:hypothetical protein